MSLYERWNLSEDVELTHDLCLSLWAVVDVWCCYKVWNMSQSPVIICPVSKCFIIQNLLLCIADLSTAITFLHLLRVCPVSYLSTLGWVDIKIIQRNSIFWMCKSWVLNWEKEKRMQFCLSRWRLWRAPGTWEHPVRLHNGKLGCHKLNFEMNFR